MQKTIRYNVRLHGQVLLEHLISDGWEAIDGKGFAAHLEKGPRIEVFPDSGKAVVFEAEGVNFQEICHLVTATLNGEEIRNRNLNCFIDIEGYEGSPRHVKQLALQINECYASQAYDGVAVLMRRMAESLLIECFEVHGLQADILQADGRYLMLADLILQAERLNSNKCWRLSTKTRQALPLVKEVGDQAAHSRHYITKKKDVDDIRFKFESMVVCLKDIAGIS